MNLLLIVFLINLTVPDKHIFSAKYEYKFKIKLLYNEDKFFFTKTELLNFMLLHYHFTLPLTKLFMIGSRLIDA